MIESFRRACGYAMPRLGRIAYETYFRLAPPESVTELFPGVRVKMNFRDESCRVTWWTGQRYEEPLPAVLRELCSEDVDTFFDVGANYGFFSYLVLAYCPTVNVYAFEPNPSNFRVLEDTRERNALVRFFPQHLGLGDQAAELELTVDMSSSGHSVFGAEHPEFDRARSQIHKHRVSVICFDDWLAKKAATAAGRSVLKMDIEGFELRALHGMTHALERRIFRALVMEVYAPTLRLFQATPMDIARFLAHFGYRPFDLALRRTEITDRDARNVIFLPE